ncbi:hypothetical protein BCR42DRAFT_419377 [Absidia repens]|uniref:4-coumarate-CoA ligase n=1 Tax=Absidia repens TaxID=90262 RepID=A0A1X2IBL3_9FUNG|nr:hypothetical protein BCR42DRAFT_419377 [Absidia repens]
MVIYKSSCHPVDIPKLDIFSFLFTPNDQNSSISHDRPLLIDAETGKTFSYAQVRSLSRKLATGWKENVGLTKGQVVAVFAPNQVDHAILYFSLLAAGCTISPGNPNYTEDEFHHQVHTSGATAIVTIPSLLPVLTKVADKNGIPKDRMFVFGEKQVEHALSFAQVTSKNEIAFPDRRIDPENDLAFIMFSSGTTGVAKGVMLSHSNFVSQVLSVMTFEKEDGAIRDNDIMLSFLPYYHIFGLTTLILRATYAMIPVVVMSKFDLKRYCELIQKYKVTIATLVPPIAVLLAKSPIVPNYDLTSLRMITSGAAPLGKEHIEQLYQRIKAPVRQGYGLSESCSGFIYQSIQAGDVGATGRLVSHALVKLVDPDGNELGDDQPGELLLKGPYQMKGYINNQKANEETFTADGWMRTGDVAKYDSKTGEFYIVDRIKELIKYKGLQVAPAELESLLVGHDQVADCCVVGVYDAAQATELPRAYIVLQASAHPSDALAQELMDYITNKVVNHKKLRGGIRFVDAIPKSAAGKILRREIKDWIKKEEQENMTQVRAKL